MFENDYAPNYTPLIEKLLNTSLEDLTKQAAEEKEPRAGQPFLIVVAGPNGSGKTTFTSQLVESGVMKDAVYINPDQIAQDKFGGWNDREAVIASAQYCENLREECLK